MLLIYQSVLVLSLLQFDVALSTMYHIISSPDDLSCPADKDHCLTLSHFATNSNILLTSNTTLCFEPGNHRLESIFLIENISRALLQFNFNQLHEPARIHCEQLGSFQFYNVSWIHVSGIEFLGCTAMVSFVDYLIVENTIFTGQKENGTALELYECTTDVTDSYFAFNTAGSHPYDNQHFLKFVRVGGAIMSTHSNLTITGTTFECNSASIGGAFYGEWSSNIVIANCTFVKNAATLITNSIQGYGGGAVYLSNSTMTVSSSIFVNNSAMGDGGVFEFHESTVTINQGKFMINRANGRGGVFTAYTVKVRIQASEFSGNKAVTRGGVIYSEVHRISSTGINFNSNIALGESDITVEGNHFRDNVAGYGGVVAVFSTSVKIIACELINNRALNFDGGVIDLRYFSGMVIRESVFTNNSAHLAGGVINALTSAMTVTASVFIYNIASVGGVISISSEERCRECIVSIVGSSFFYNIASNQGGTISSAKLNITISDNNFKGNTAKHGGAMHMTELYANIGTSEFHNNSALQGGALFITTFTDSMNATIIMSNFSDNYAFQGGVLYVSRKSSVQMYDVNVHLNFANVGVVYIFDSIGILSGKIMFTENFGSLFTVNSKIFITNYTEFINCSPLIFNKTAFPEGGAVTVIQSEIVFNGFCTIMYNEAKNGGALYASASKVYVKGGKVTIANNTATETGGGIYLYQSELNCQDDSTLNISGNSAIERGGGVHAVSSTIIVESFSTLISVQYVSDYGGSKLFFIENRANRGGAIYLEVNAKLHILF